MKRIVTQLPVVDPDPVVVDPGLHAACLAACVRAATVCNVTADGLLDAPTVADLREAIRSCLDSASVCSATAAVLSRHAGEVSQTTRWLLETCLEACAASARQCELRATSLEHCRMCAAECRRCEAACQALLAAMTP